MEYSHTQTAPLHYIIYGVAVLLLGIAWNFGENPVAAMVMVVAAGAIVVLALSFRSLTVLDEGTQLAIRFGPLPLFRTSIPYRDITQVEAGRSSFIDGWGIHYLPGRGWTYNLWGFDCALLHTGKTIVRVGTDDVVRLVDFLNQKTSPPGV